MGQDSGIYIPKGRITTGGTILIDTLLLTRGYKVKEEDTLIASRFIEDSIGNGYEIEYKYAMPDYSMPTKTLLYSQPVFDTNDSGSSLGEKAHTHYISLVNIIAFKGNKQHTIASNIKAIYSPTECQSDSRELWLKRLYQIQNKKK